MLRRCGWIFFLFGLSSCATLDYAEKEVPPSEQIDLFSSLNEGASMPKAWQIWRVTPQKNKTNYTLKTYQGKTVLHASSTVAASGLVLPLKPRPSHQQKLVWEWKALGAISESDNAIPQKDDSPLRIMVAFDGDKSKLNMKDQMAFELAKIISGHDMPYATLMYVWASKRPTEEVIEHARTGRIRMIVVDTGEEHIGQWRRHERDLTQDYIRAYKEQPGKIIGMGLMTDSDNTRTEVQAIYGDIKLIHSAK